nr:hypothetical protein [Tanacetum cinerariifolium]
ITPEARLTYVRLCSGLLSAAGASRALSKSTHLVMEIFMYCLEVEAACGCSSSVSKNDVDVRSSSTRYAFEVGWKRFVPPVGV